MSCPWHRGLVSARRAGSSLAGMRHPSRYQATRAEVAGPLPRWGSFWAWSSACLLDVAREHDADSGHRHGLDELLLRRALPAIFANEKHAAAVGLHLPQHRRIVVADRGLEFDPKRPRPIRAALPFTPRPERIAIDDETNT